MMKKPDVKKWVKSSFLGRYLVSELHCVESRLLPLLISDEKAVKRFYKRSTGRDLPLDNPQTFSEKLNWYKLNARDPLMQQCADKVGVREYIKQCGYEQNLNEIYGVYSRVEDIDINALPDRFVLKAAHGSHMNLIVKDKSRLDWKKERWMVRSWLHQNIAWSGREWVYKDMPKRIIAEKYLEDDFGELRDYKFFCFHGVPCRFEYDIGRFSGGQYRNYYDIDGSLLPINDGTPANPNEKLALTDSQLSNMIKIASVLSAPFQQVRVDFYLANEKVYIGEMTFFDGGGSTNFTPDEWNYRFSESWLITKNIVSA